MRSFNCFITLLILMNFASCAKTKEAEVLSAIAEAQYYLDSSRCSKAIDILDEVGSQKSNASYVSVYASALACQSGYADLDILDNLANINTGGAGGAGFIKSFAAFGTSNETDVDQSTYTKLFDAINYILEANGGAQPSTVSRIAKYGVKKSNDLSMQTIMMLTTAMGKFFALYGNADTDGTKGAGSTYTNICLYSYTMADAVNFINANTPQSCTSATGTEGSDFLEAPVTASLTKSRLCEGVILFNNFFDILSNIDLSSNSSLGQLTSVGAVISTILTAAQTVEGGFNTVPAAQDSIALVRDIRGMDTCEALDIQRLEKWYALLFETIF